MSIYLSDPTNQTHTITKESLPSKWVLSSHLMFLTADFFLCQYVKQMFKTGDTESDNKKRFLILNFVLKITIGKLMSPKFFKKIIYNTHSLISFLKILSASIDFSRATEPQ